MVLEQLQVSHTEEAFRLWSDFEAVKFTNWTHTPTYAECVERVGKVAAFYAKEPLHFGPFIIRDQDSRFMGMIGADLVDRTLGVYDIWYIVCREEWGKGVATRALGVLIALMKASGRVRKITADVVAVNVYSRRLLEGFGCRCERVVAGGFQRHESTLDLCKYC